MSEESIIVKKSVIAGAGVFATRAIKKGETICHMRGTLVTLQQKSSLVDQDKEESSDPLGVDDELYMD